MRYFIFIVSLFFACQAQAANLDTKLGIVSDLHHDQLEDNVNESLVPMISLVNQMEPGITNWLGMGDMIDTSAGDSGPYSANDADMQAAFDDAGITFKSVIGNHDRSGGVPVPPLFPDEYWTWDIGDKWRIIAMEAGDDPGESISLAKQTWLEGQITQAATDSKYVIVATHFQVGTTRSASAVTLTPSGTTGTITVTASESIHGFGPGLLNQRLYLRHGTCSDESCWGWGTMTAYGGDGTSATIEVVKDFISTDPADEWDWLGTKDMVSNSSDVRAKLEATGSTAKLGLSGHTHRTGNWTVNGIDYVSVTSGRNTGGLYGIAQTGGILYLYDDGTWKIRGTGMQPSYNWTEFYVDSASGDDTLNGGTASYDAWKTWDKIKPALSAGVSANLVSNLTSDIELNGSAGSFIGIKAATGPRPKITGDIAGSYLDIDNVDIGTATIFKASNSVINGVRVAP